MVSLGAVVLPSTPPERLRPAAVAAEEAGLDELWLWEDCFWSGGVASASAVLAWTGRLCVGIGVLPVPLRNVALTAMEVAALHRLFPGRVRVGVGHGVQDWMRQVGAAVDSPVTLLREHVVALRALLRGEQVSVDGRYVHLDGVALGWPPSDAPAVLVGTGGPRSLRLAGEISDGVVLGGGTPPERVREARRLVDEGRAAGGRSGPPDVVVYVHEAEVSGAGSGGVRPYVEAGADTLVLFPDDGDDPVEFVRRVAREVRPLLVG